MNYVKNSDKKKKKDCLCRHALDFAPVRFCAPLQYACLSSQASIPPRYGNCEGLAHTPQGCPSMYRRSSVLDTYGAETNLGNKLSSNNSIMHVSQSNNAEVYASGFAEVLSMWEAFVFSLECLWTKACDSVILSMSRSVGLGENVLHAMNDLGPIDATRVCFLNILTCYALKLIYKYFDILR